MTLIYLRVHNAIDLNVLKGGLIVISQHGNDVDCKTFFLPDILKSYFGDFSKQKLS